MLYGDYKDLPSEVFKIFTVKSFSLAFGKVILQDQEIRRMVF